MIYRVEYFIEGALKGSSAHEGDETSAVQFARDGLIRHHCDFARIIEEDSGLEVESVRRAD